MDEQRESLERIKEREREAMRLAGIQTLNAGYGFLKSNITTYDEHLFPGDTSIFDTIRAIHAKHPDRPVRILDFGCGSNAALRSLKQQMPDIPFELVGVSIEDPRDEFDKRTDKELGIQFVNVSSKPVFRASPDGVVRKHEPKASFVAGEGEKFDLIITRFALQHVPDVFRVMRGLYQSLEPDGVMHAHIGEYTSAERFAGREGGTPTYEDYAFGSKEFNDTVDELIAGGVQIERHYPSYPEVYVIKKSPAQMKFPNLRYKLDGTTTGQIYTRAKS